MLKKRIKELIFKNKSLFTSCISKTNNTFIDNADLDIVMQMYNLFEYSDNYSDIRKFVELL